MTKTSKVKVVRKIYIGGKEHEILYNEKELEEEFRQIDELEERKMKIESCLKLKVKENDTVSKENDNLVCRLEDVTNELIKLKAQLMEDRSYYELKKTQFCKKMMRHQKKSIGLLTEDSVESIANRLEMSDSLPSLNCRRLLNLYKQWRIITYNNCENFLRLHQYKDEVVSEISTVRREFKKAKFEILGSHKQNTLQYLNLIDRQRTGKKNIEIHRTKEIQIIERMKILKVENEKLKKLFQDLYDRIGNVGDDEDDLNHVDNEDKINENAYDNNRIMGGGHSLSHNDANKNEKRDENNNTNSSRDDTSSVSSSSSESILFDRSSIHEKDSRVSVNASCSSESSYLELSNRGGYSVNHCTNSEVQLNRNTSSELNASDSFISLCDVSRSKKSKKKRHVTFRDKAICINEDAREASSKTIKEEEDLIEASSEKKCTLEEKKSGVVEADPCEENLVKQAWKDEFNEEKLLPKASSSSHSSILSKHDSGIADNESSNGSSLRDLSVDELIRVQDRIFNLEMNMKLNDCKNYSSKVNYDKCQTKTD